MNDQLLFGGYWLVFFVLHSLLASTRVKGLLQSIGISFSYYRLFYNVIAILSLLPVLIKYRTMEKTQLFESFYLNQLPGFVLILASLILWRITFRNYSLSEFLGTDRLAKNYSDKAELRKNALNAFVRHPLYSVSFIFLTGLFLLYPNDLILISCVLITIYFPIGIYFEEVKMIRDFGDEYLEYKKKVPKLIPRIPKESKNRAK